ncbi:DUF5681 domain-containing protein [Falsiroseomonas sp.]|uniref:DUF5681 domain-containing protein n=1 Tax=Falsiroseomonas sp. TaxID=2870721 RepID=UPI00356A7F9C
MARTPPRSAGTYTVGYGKPPEHSRFRPGESGNRRGRPKGARNLRTYLEQALAELVVVKEGSRTRKISKGEVAMTQLVNKAAAADLKAMRLLLDMERRREGTGIPMPTALPAEVNRSDPEPPKPDYDKMTTRELEILFEAAQIMEGKRERPPPPVPPSGPEESEE